MSYKKRLIIFFVVITITVIVLVLGFLLKTKNDLNNLKNREPINEEINQGFKDNVRNIFEIY